MLYKMWVWLVVTRESYFDLLKGVLQDNNLMNSLGQIYNVDESGMPLNHCAPKVVTQARKMSGSELQGTKVISLLWGVPVQVGR